MRAFEFYLKEDPIDDMIEDNAEVRGDANLVTALEFLRNRSANKHVEPRIRADSLIDLVKRTGHETFSIHNLEDSFKTNDTVKGLIKDIKDDPDGTKYVYLVSMDEDPEALGSLMDPDTPKTQPEKTVGAMAKRALTKRS